MASAQAADVLRMRVELPVSGVGRERSPEGVRVRTFLLADAAELHALLEHGYRNGGGSVASFEEWLGEMTGDEEYDPALWFLAHREHELAGATLCWTSAFVKDLVVAERWRGKGLGETLMCHAFRAFARRGANAVELKVHADNRPAIRLYERLGMHVVERLPAA